MQNREISTYRLFNQQVSGTKFSKPEELTRWLLAIQAQNYNSSKWALGSRLPGITNYDIEKSIADRKIIRTWLMRGTLHLVSSEDVRWILSLLAPKIIANTAFRLRQLELDTKTISRSFKLLLKALDNEKEITRNKVKEILENAGINTGNLRLQHILFQAVMEQLVCFSTKYGNDFKIVLLDNYIPDIKPKSRDEALFEIARRYFTSRGPATLDDFIWWSGLNVKDARAGLEAAAPKLIKENISGKEFWLNNNMPSLINKTSSSYLLAGFDEYLISYRDRNECIDPLHAPKVISKNGIFDPIIVLNGKVAGKWKAETKKDKILIQKEFFVKVNKPVLSELEYPAKKYVEFIGKKAPSMY